jgi:hypothetical protein
MAFRDAGGGARFCEAVMALFGVAWWLCGALVFSVLNGRVDAGEPALAARQGVVAICWVATALYVVLVVVSTYMGFKLAKAHKREKRAAKRTTLDTFTQLA